MPFESGRHYEDGDVVAVCVGFIVPGFGTTYIAVFEHNEGAKNLAQHPVCASNSKYIDVRTPVLRELIFGKIHLLFEFKLLISATSRRHVCYTFRRARRRGDAFRRAVCKEREIKSSFCGCLRSRIIMRNLFFLIQLEGPVLSTSISRKSGITSEFI